MFLKRYNINATQLNVNKCEIINFTDKFNYNTNGKILENAEYISGVEFESKRCFDEHIHNIKSSIRTLGFIVRSTRNFSNNVALSALCFSLITR